MSLKNRIKEALQDFIKKGLSLKSLSPKKAVWKSGEGSSRERGLALSLFCAAFLLAAWISGSPEIFMSLLFAFLAFSSAIFLRIALCSLSMVQDILDFLDNQASHRAFPDQHGNEVSVLDILERRAKLPPKGWRINNFQIFSKFSNLFEIFKKKSKFSKSFKIFKKKF